MKIFLTVVISFSFIGWSYSQDAPSPITTIPQLKDSIKAIMEKEHIVGLMLGIATKDSILFSRGLGYADLENQKVADGKNIISITAVTKMFISLAIMKLVEEGKLSLQDEFETYSPKVSWPFETCYKYRTI